MGMYDHIIDFTCECPSCGFEVKDFQTKQGPQCFANLRAEDVLSWHSDCDNCGMFIRFEWNNSFKHTYLLVEPTVELL